MRAQPRLQQRWERHSTSKRKPSVVLLLYFDPRKDSGAFSLEPYVQVDRVGRQGLEP